MKRFVKITTLMVIFAFAFMPVFVPSFSVFGQSSNDQDLEVISIDIDNLPGIVLQIKGKNMDSDFITAPVSIKEDGVERLITSEDLSEVGLQIAFVMDPTQNLTAPGNTGDARWFEIASAAGGLVNSSILSAQTDIMAVYGPTQDASEFLRLEGWLRDHQAVVNTLYQYVAAETVSDTPNLLLSDAIVSTLNEFGDESPVVGAEKVIIVFSDGSDLLETEEVNEVVDLAEELDVQINVVMLGADTPIPKGNLKRLSTGTNGLFEVLTTVNDLDPIWKMLQQRRTIREITYDLGSASAEMLDVAVDLPNGQTFSTTINYPEFDIGSVTVSIVSPSEAEAISFDLVNGDVTESEIAIPVVVDVDWSDDSPREFSQIEYWIDGIMVAQEDVISDELMLPLADIENGEHTLSAVVVDKLGMEFVSPSRTFALDVTRAESTQTQSNSANSVAATQPDNEEALATESASDADNSTTMNSLGSASDATTGATATGATATGATTVGATTVGATTVGVTAAGVTTAGATTTGATTTGISALSDSSDVAAQAAIDAAIRNTPTEQAPGGMNLFGLELPPEINIFGIPFLINPFTLLIASFPLIFALALLTYWLSQRSTPKMAYNNDYEFYDTGQVPTIENNVFFEDDGQLQVTQPQVGVIDIEDDITEPVEVPSFYTTAPAYLIYVSGGNHLPKKLPVEGGEPIRIGRKKSFCELVLDDRRVSRLHSVITLVDDAFYIRDEGSSGGTFVNRRKLGTVDNQELKHNDIVNFNEVEYRFESTAEQTDEESSEPSVFAPPLENMDM